MLRLAADVRGFQMSQRHFVLKLPGVTRKEFILNHFPNRGKVRVCSLSESESRTTQPWGYTHPPHPTRCSNHPGLKRSRVAWTTNQWWSSLMKRPGLSGDNGHQQRPSQTIRARTLWWMRRVLNSLLVLVALVSAHPPPPNLCRPASFPFHLNPPAPFKNEVCHSSLNPCPRQTDHAGIKMGYRQQQRGSEHKGISLQPSKPVRR